MYLQEWFAVTEPFVFVRTCVFVLLFSFCVRLVLLFSCFSFLSCFLGFFAPSNYFISESKVGMEEVGEGEGREEEEEATRAPGAGRGTAA